MDKLPTEEELNLYIKKLPNEEVEEEKDQYFEICHWWQISFSNCCYDYNAPDIKKYTNIEISIFCMLFYYFFVM